MYPLNYSWAIHPRGTEVNGQLRVIGNLKVKRGCPQCAVRYEHGSACLAMLNSSYKCEYVYFDNQGRVRHTSEADGLWSKGYIKSDVGGYLICDHMGNRTYEFTGYDSCNCIGGLYFKLGSKYICHLSCDSRLDISGMCGNVTGAIEIDGTAYVVGTAGFMAARTHLNDIQVKWNLTADTVGTFPRIVPLDARNIALVSVNRETNRTRFYRVCISDATCSFICEAPFEAQQEMLSGELSHGVIPFGDGVVCYGSAGSVSAGYYYCDYQTKQWRLLPIPSRGLCTERQVSVGGRIVSLLDDRRGGRTLSVHNLEYEKTYERRIPRRFPAPTCETLNNICPDGIIVVREGKRNQEVTFYELV